MIPTQTESTFQLLSLPNKQALCEAFVGKSVSSLRTPAAIIDRSVFKSNCEAMATKVKDHGLRFRAHIKTHKTVEGIEMQLKAGGGGDKAVVCSTMTECWQVAQSRLVRDGLVNDILYGMPLGLDRLREANRLASFLRQSHDDARFRVFVDSLTQVQALNEYAESEEVDKSHLPWSVMIKLDGGYHRAGFTVQSDDLKLAIKQCLASPHIDLYGFYAHFGHSYNARSEEDAHSYLRGEIEAINTAAKLALELDPQRDARTDRPYVLSFGATPTAHVSHLLGDEKVYGELELHAGNYCCLDLQQVATNLVKLDNVAVSVLSRVISVYPHRGEALCDAGGIAMSKDTGPIPGHGAVVSPKELNNWKLGRVSQEHGILVQDSDASKGQSPEIGQVIRIVGQHACMVLSNHSWFYIVEDGGDQVVDVWVPWKGW